MSDRPPPEHPSLVDLPAAYTRLLPALDDLDPPDESRATCATCPQAAPPEGPTPTRPFLPDVACCTYHPRLPNFLAGRALRRGGVGADRIRTRMRRERDGLRATGIFPPASFRDRYRGDGFGTDRSLTCPFWVPGELSCSIWRDRNAVCRTWFCRTQEGPRGIRYWKTVRDALTVLEQRLAAWLVENGDPPHEDATAEAFERFYLDCIERLETASDDALARVELPERDGLTLALQVYDRLRHMRRPDDAVARVQGVVPDGDALLFAGYSELDRVRLPRTFMAVFGQLAEGASWDDAVAHARETYGLTFDDDLADLLWDRGVLVPSPDAAMGPEARALRDISNEDPGLTHRDGDVTAPDTG